MGYFCKIGGGCGEAVAMADGRYYRECIWFVRDFFGRRSAGQIFTNHPGGCGTVSLPKALVNGRRWIGGCFDLQLAKHDLCFSSNPHFLDQLILWTTLFEIPDHMFQARCIISQFLW